MYKETQEKISALLDSAVSGRARCVVVKVLYQPDKASSANVSRRAVFEAFFDVQTKRGQCDLRCHT